MWQEIIKRTAERTNRPVELVRNVHDNFWQTIRYYLTNPLLTNARIYINEFFKFYIPENRVAVYLSKIPFLTKNNSEEKKQFYEQLLQQIKYGEKTKPSNEQKKSRQS